MMRDIYIILSAFILSNNGFGQSKGQLSDRKIVASKYVISDQRKGDINRIIDTRYDKKGNPIEITEYVDGLFLKKELINYNKFGDEELIQQLDSLGNILEKKTFSFDALGNSLGYIVENAQHQIEEELVIELNKFGEKIAETLFEMNHQLKTKTIFEYNKIGLITEKRIYNNKNELIYRKASSYE